MGSVYAVCGSLAGRRGRQSEQELRSPQSCTRCDVLDLSVVSDAAQHRSRAERAWRRGSCVCPSAARPSHASSRGARRRTCSGARAWNILAPSLRRLQTSTASPRAIGRAQPQGHPALQSARRLTLRCDLVQSAFLFELCIITQESLCQIVLGWKIQRCAALRASAEAEPRRSMGPAFLVQSSS